MPGHNFFKDLAKLLRHVASLTPDEAAVYALGLERGTITTSDVEESMNKRQSSAGAILRRLAKKGYFNKSLSNPDVKGGKGHGQKFTSIPPNIALQDTFVNYDKFKELLGVLEQHFEVNASSIKVDEDFYQIPQKTMKNHFRGSIDSAKSTINILCNDCSWMMYGDILHSLENAHKRGVKEIVITKEISSQERPKLINVGAELVIAKCNGPPFSLIDENILYLAIKFGTIQDYSLLFTLNPYMIKNFKSLFEVYKLHKKSGDVT